MLQTICRDCIFSVWAPNELGNIENKTQLDCSISKIKADKAELVTEDNKSYYKLDYLCRHCRNEDWAKEHQVTSNRERLQVIRKENSISSDVIILVGPNHLIKDIERIIPQIQNPLIQKVIIVVNNQKLDVVEVNRALQALKKKWHLIYEFEDTEFHRQVNQAFKYVVSQYYIVVEYLSQYNDSLPTAIDTAINDYGKRFCMVQSEGYNNVIMQTRLHEAVKDFFPEAIHEKYKDTEWSNLIINHNQLTSR